MGLKITILGCGSSGGVPRIGGHWGACDPAEPKNRRRRCALLVQREGSKGTTTVLVDSPPDLREQLLEADVAVADAVFYTHDHADHTHGIDDLRMLVFNARRMLPIYHSAETGAVLRDRFDYCFATPPGSEYPPILLSNDIKAGETTTIEGRGGPVRVTAFEQQHGSATSLGFRFGKIAYSPDVSDLPPETLPLLEDLDVWIVDALRPSTHPSHFNVEQALGWIAQVAPRRAVLTHMHVDLDYQALRRILPEGVEPAYDGLVLETE